MEELAIVGWLATVVDGLSRYGWQNRCNIGSCSIHRKVDAMSLQEGPYAQISGVKLHTGKHVPRCVMVDLDSGLKARGYFFFETSAQLATGNVNVLLTMLGGHLEFVSLLVKLQHL